MPHSIRKSNKYNLKIHVITFSRIFRKNFFLGLDIFGTVKRIKTRFSTNIIQVLEKIFVNFLSIISILTGDIRKAPLAVAFSRKSNFCHNFFSTQPIATKFTSDLDDDEIQIVAKFEASTRRGFSASAVNSIALHTDTHTHSHTQTVSNLDSTTAET